MQEPQKTLNLADILAEKPPRIGKTGYVALIGRPNTGKSTLLNTFLQTHLAAVSSKPQTTRKHLLGIFTDDSSQILFLDAPGIHEPHSAIDDSMDRSIQRVLKDSDIAVCLADPTRKPGAEDELAIQRIQAARKKDVIIAINKIDIATPEQMEECQAFYQQAFPQAKCVRIAAIDRQQSEPLLVLLKNNLPEGPFLYEEDELTDVYERDIAAELIREVLLEQLRQEVPHCTAVTIDKWDDREDHIFIGVTLNIEREGQKGIILGKGGERIKAIRLEAAKRISGFVSKRVELSLFVKIKPDWRNNKRFLSDIGLE
ncbi:MAG: GTPase Era [Victivallales bacterium]|nr:GTPase Era [Victivallales bacterium]